MGASNSLIGSLVIPRNCFFVILWNASATMVHVPETELSVCMPLLGSLAEPRYGLLVVGLVAQIGELSSQVVI